ncbi:hypothetical protein ADJ73_12130 [Arsenicicoccus sp. oral taxon 190]|nr:hypothetical protein ADJ73_12130 [Arsenicicoccus sp. oral taxon 190]
MATIRHTHPLDEPRLPSPRVPSLALWGVVAIPSLLQLAAPALLSGLRRDWSLIEAGELWRLGTSAVVQDGGLAGTAFNLVILAVVLLAAQDHWRPARTWATFWVGAVLANIVVGPSLYPVGAGNSMATFILATALATNVLSSHTSRAARVPAMGALACVGFLLLVGDYHGYAALLGLPAGLLRVGKAGPRPGPRPSRSV